MANLAPLTKAELKDMVRHFYRLGDAHAPQSEYLSMLAEDMQIVAYPDGSGFQGIAGFEQMYQCMIRQLFDEHHDIQSIDVDLSEDRTTADVNILVAFTGKMWNPPSAKSMHVRSDTYFHWQVKRSAMTGKPVITLYRVKEVNFHKGSAVYIPDRYALEQFVPEPTRFEFHYQPSA